MSEIEPEKSKKALETVMSARIAALNGYAASGFVDLFGLPLPESLKNDARRRARVVRYLLERQRRQKPSQ